MLTIAHQITSYYWLQSTCSWPAPAIYFILCTHTDCWLKHRSPPKLMHTPSYSSWFAHHISIQSAPPYPKACFNWSTHLTGCIPPSPICNRRTRFRISWRVGKPLPSIVPIIARDSNTCCCYFFPDGAALFANCMVICTTNWTAPGNGNPEKCKFLLSRAYVAGSNYAALLCTTTTMLVAISMFPCTCVINSIQLNEREHLVGKTKRHWFCRCIEVHCCSLISTEHNDFLL